MWQVKESRRAFEPHFDRHTQCVVNSSRSLFIHVVLVFIVLVVNRHLCLCTTTFVGNRFNLIFTVKLLRLLRSHIKCVQWFELAQVGRRLADRRQIRSSLEEKKKSSNAPQIWHDKCAQKHWNVSCRPGERALQRTVSPPEGDVGRRAPLDWCV